MFEVLFILLITTLYLKLKSIQKEKSSPLIVTPIPNTHKYQKLVPMLESFHFTPHILGFCTQMQAIVYLIVEIITRTHIPMEREILKLQDGGTIAIDWQIDHKGGRPIHDSRQPIKNRPILLCVQGLNGGNNNIYTTSLTKFVGTEYKVGLIAFRGTNDLNLTSPTWGTGCSWKDIEFAFQFVRKEYPENRLFGYGVSLGGILLANYLMKGQNTEKIIDGAVLYGAPLQPELSYKYFIAHTFGALNFALGINLNSQLKISLETIKPMLSSEEYEYYRYHLSKCKNLSEMDEFVQSRMAGFKNREDFYLAMSSTGRLKNIKVPTFMLNSEDDFIFEKQHNNLKEIEQSDYVIAGWTKSGGHVSHFEQGYFPSQWYQKPCKAFLQQLNTSLD